MEHQISQLYFDHFLLVKSVTNPDAQIQSMSARMWHDRKQLRLVFVASVKTFFSQLEALHPVY